MVNRETTTRKPAHLIPGCKSLRQRGACEATSGIDLRSFKSLLSRLLGPWSVVVNINSGGMVREPLQQVGAGLAVEVIQHLPHALLTDSFRPVEIHTPVQCFKVRPTCGQRGP